MNLTQNLPGRGRGNTPRRKGMLVEVNRDLSSEQWDKPGSGSEKALKQILMKNFASTLRLRLANSVKIGNLQITPILAIIMRFSKSPSESQSRPINN